MIKVYKFICFIFFMQLVATSYANELINSKIFGLANHPDAQMCAVKKIYPFPLKLSKTFPSSKAGQHGLGRISAETKAIHKHFFSLAEGCRSSSTQFRDKTCKQIIGSLKKILDEDAYGHKAFKKTSALAGFALSSRIAYPMFIALETAMLYDITKEEAIKTRNVLLKWFKKRRVKVINFFESKTDKLWNNHDVAWEVLLAVAGIEDNTEGSIERINTTLDKTFANMRSDGSIPAETKRGAMALHYTALNLSFLLRGMMILQANEKIKEKHIYDFEKAVDYYLLALADFKLIDSYAAENHNPGRDNPRELEFFALHGGIGMVRLFADKFDRSDLKKRLRNLTIDDRMCSYTNTKRKAKEWLASCPSPKIRLEKNYSFMTPLGLNGCLYNSFIPPSQQ